MKMIYILYKTEVNNGAIFHITVVVATFMLFYDDKNNGYK